MKSYVPTKAEIPAANKYHAYMQGWRDGAAARAMRHSPVEREKDAELTAIYGRAYEEGRREAGVAARRASRIFKYKPSFFRTHVPVSE